MKQTNFFLLMLGGFLSVSVLAADGNIVSSDWRDWMTSLITLTPAQTGLVMTSALAIEVGNIINLWDRCWTHRYSEHYSRANCVTEITASFAKWGVELAALGKVTGWYKRDDIDLENLLGIKLIDNYSVISNKRDGTAEVSFSVGNETYLHLSHVRDDAEDYQLAIMGHANDNNNTVNAVVEIVDGTFVWSPSQPTALNKRDGIDSDMYVSGQGSAIFECQYGAGISSDHYIHNDVYEHIMAHSRSRLAGAKYIAFHGYVGSNSRMKCAMKVYDNDQSWDSWREWGDVWSSF